MNKMKINFDELYGITYHNEYQKLFSKAIAIFMENSKHSLFFKRDILIEEIKSEFELMTSKKISDSNSINDEYTIKLLREYKSRIIDYNDNKITNFINDYLNKLKTEFINKAHNVPDNIKLNPKKTVEFIAKYYVYETFIKHLYKIRRDDGFDLIEKKLSADGFIDSSFQINDLLDENEGNDDKLTTKHQTLIILYMLKSL